MGYDKQTEDSKSRYEKNKAANERYLKKFTSVLYRMKPEDKVILSSYADKYTNGSMNKFIQQAIEAYIQFLDGGAELEGAHNQYEAEQWLEQHYNVQRSVDTTDKTPEEIKDAEHELVLSQQALIIDQLKEQIVEEINELKHKTDHNARATLNMVSSITDETDKHEEAIKQLTEQVKEMQKQITFLLSNQSK